jgi:hypothetical protein
MEAGMDATRKSLLQSLALALCALIAVVGCKSHANSELLERELRKQEDCIYHLEGELDSMDAMLESARRENMALKKEMSSGDKGASGGGSLTPSVTIPPSISAPSISVPSISPPSPTPARPRTTVPRGDPVEEAPKFESPDAEPTLPDPNEPPPLFKPTGATSIEPSLDGDPKKITRLALNRQLTGGWNPDHHHGDEGIFVAFEPRDAANKLVEATGDISIVVLDPMQTGAAARVGRWDFTSDEAAMHFSKRPLGRGLQFELPWPSAPPANRELRLFVRLTTPDGRKIDTDTKIRVTLCDQNGKDWASKSNAADGPTLAVPEDAKPIQHTQPVRKAAKAPAWSPDRS